MDLRQTQQYAKYLKSIGWRVKKDRNTNSYIYLKKLPLLPLHVVKIQRPRLPVNKIHIEKLIHKYNVIQSNIEPLGDDETTSLSLSGYKRNKVPFLPSSTILIDISMQKNSLLSMMKSKTRYNIKQSIKKGVEVKILNGKELVRDMKSFDDLFEMQKQNAKRLGIFVLPKRWLMAQVKSFGGKCFAVMAYKESVLLAATFYMTSKTHVYYSHNGSSDSGRKNYAPTLCVWEGMLEGKRRNIENFDFEGIYDARSKIVKWQGFTRFKEGFGGRKVMYPGLYSKWHFPI